jgi:hypothetical protein
MEFWNAVGLGVSISFSLLVLLAYTAAKIYANYRAYMLLESLNTNMLDVKSKLDDRRMAVPREPVMLNAPVDFPYSSPDQEKLSVTGSRDELYEFFVKEYAKQGYPAAMAQEMASEVVNQELGKMVVTE